MQSLNIVLALERHNREEGGLAYTRLSLEESRPTDTARFSLRKNWSHIGLVESYNDTMPNTGGLLRVNTRPLCRRCQGFARAHGMSPSSGYLSPTDAS